MAKLFVIANSPGQLSHAEMQNRQAVLKYVKEHDYTGMSRSKARSLLMPGKESEHALSLMLEMDKTLGETEFLSQYENTTDRDDLSEKIAFFDFPTDFYYSKHDALVDAGFLNRLADMNPNVTAIQSSTAGHMLPLQLPEELARLLVEWIETN
jgi:pimeloyl-ACP methyl ester carboxylesterase